MQSRLLWEPKANVEALIDEFMAAYYGPAASEMRAYFNFMYRELDSRAIHQSCYADNPGELVTDQYAKKALEMFERAQIAVANDSIRLRRVEAEKFCVLWSDIYERNTSKNNLSVSLSEYAQRFAEMVRIARDMKVIQLRSSSKGDQAYFKNWVKSVASLHLQSEPWYNDPAVDILIAHPDNLFMY